MSDYLFLAPVVIVGTLAAIVGLYMKFTAGDGTESRIKVAFDLTKAQSDRLRKEADRIGIEPSTLARWTLAHLLDDDFNAAIGRALQEKANLYKQSA